MKKIMILLLLSLLPSAFCVEDTAVFSLNLVPDNAQYLRFGFLSHEPTSFGGDITEISISEIELDFPHRSGLGVIVENTDQVYAFYEAYGSHRFEIYMSLELSNSQSAFTVSWSDGSMDSTDTDGERIFSYRPSDGISSQYRELSIAASIPANATGSDAYSIGTINLNLEVLD